MVNIHLKIKSSKKLDASFQMEVFPFAIKLSTMVLGVFLCGQNLSGEFPSVA